MTRPSRRSLRMGTVSNTSPYDALDVDAGIDQARGHAQRARAGRALLEAAGVGDQGDVEGLGDLGLELDPERLEEVEQDLGGRRRRAVHDVDVAEPGVVVVVITSITVTAAATRRDGARAAASSRSRGRAASSRRARPGRRGARGRRRRAAQLARDRRVGIEVGAHLLAQPAQAGRRRDQRADGVAVGVLVGGDDDAVGRAERCDRAREFRVGCPPPRLVHASMIRSPRACRNGAQSPSARAISPSPDSTTGRLCSPSSTPVHVLAAAQPRGSRGDEAGRDREVERLVQPVRERLRRSGCGKNCGRSGRRRGAPGDGGSVGPSSCCIGL